MKKFEIEMDIHFTKTLHIEAPNEDAATVLAETMLLCTDALPLTGSDMVGLITTATELDKKPVPKAVPADDEDEEDDDDFCCGDCTICGMCDEDEDDAAEDEEERIDELVHKLMEAIEDATDAVGSAIAVADALKKITGKDIFSQMMK